MQMPFLEIWSMLLSWQVLHRTNSSQTCVGEGGAGGGGVEDILFFSAPVEIFKRKFHPWKFGTIMYVTCLRNFKVKNQPRPLEILHEFFLVSLRYFLLFLITLTPGNSAWYVWSTPGNSISSTTYPPVWVFSRIVQSQITYASSNTVL